MKNKIVILSLIALSFAACKSAVDTNDALSIVPQQVTSVMGFDIAQMMQKADFEAIKKMDFYQKMYSDSSIQNTTMAEVFKNHSKSGIDLNRKVYLMMMQPTKGFNYHFNGLVMALKSVDDFEAMLKGKEKEIQRKGNLKYIATGNNIMAWNDSKAMVGTSQDSDPSMTAQKLFDLNAEYSIYNNESLKKSMSQKHDINVWMNSNAYADTPEASMQAGVLGVDVKSLKDNYLSGYMDFNNGEIVGKNNFELQKGLLQQLEILFKGEATTDFSKHLPNTGRGAIMSVALNTKGIKQYLAENGSLGALANTKFDKIGLTTEDIFKMLDGEVALANYNNADSKDVVFVAKIADNEIVKKFIAFGTKVNALKSVTTNVYALHNDIAAQMPQLKLDKGGFLVIQNGILYITSSRTMATQLATGKEYPSDPEVKKITANSVITFIGDSQNLPIAMPGLGKNIVFKANLAGAEMNIGFDDKNTNALKAFFEILNQRNLAQKK